ncbi:ATP-grasp domain-containing protein [Actinomadura macrotermitis]|uniref:ATP-grasp fold RimK-type domain-containing protein n=1 Tax=Actinomadura macrotermitis TaxID=2585200 RepID=A0A7K0C152_9ACTN|nr:hypothetical protein [Actinomadura macrotermitis]MQY07086.1 hypothetical protein [Actinomadura macrotermitis]
MKVAMVTADRRHPLLTGAAELLSPRHRVQWIHPDDEPPALPADVYLLKARTPRALALARALERSGAPVLNPAAATADCQDRVLMEEIALRAGLPFARAVAVSTPRRLIDEGPLPYPVVIKSRHSRSRDLVTRADGPADLRALMPEWADEPVVVQRLAANDGWDRKLWIIGGRVFAALRPSELAARPHVLPPGDIPPAWIDLAHRAGEAFGLQVFGVDVVCGPGRDPLVVDVNAFPGARGQEGAPAALAALALRAAEAGV